MHAKVLAAPFDRDKAERARNKFIEIQVLIDALDRAIGGEGRLAGRLSSGRSDAHRQLVAAGYQKRAREVRGLFCGRVPRCRLTPRHLVSVGPGENGAGMTGWPGSCFDRFALT